MEIRPFIFIVSKSRYEIELEKYSTEDEARLNFGSEEVWNDIREGHISQKKNIAKVVELVGKDKVIDRSKLDSTCLKEHKFFVLIGGDNHFTFCTQIILKYQQDNPHEQKFVLGVVLDPRKSLGALLHFTIDSLLDYLSTWNEESYKIERWTTLQAEVISSKIFDNKKSLVFPAIGDYFIGELGRFLISRNKVFLNGKEVFPDKSSGVLVTCGSGTGKGSWYNNVHQVTFGESDILSREEECARVILTEHESRSKVVLHKNEELIIHSYNDGFGVICPDSHMEHAAKFSIGSKATIRINEHKLMVIVPS